MSNSSTYQPQGFWSRIDRSIVEGFSRQQRKAIEMALGGQENERSRVSDIRLSFGRFFLVLLWGREKRGHERLVQERRNHPVFTLRNLPMILIIWISILFTGYSVAAVTFRLISAALI